MGLKITLDSVFFVAPDDLAHEIIVANDGDIVEATAMSATYSWAAAKVVRPVNKRCCAVINAAIEIGRGGAGA